MTHGSLFSGIGGFDLAAEWAGWNNIFHCELNPFGQKILKYHFPKSISYNDITKTDFTIHDGSIDVLSGGFPCQPYSIAGLRKGKEDERHLWPQMLRTIREVKPIWVVGENVRGLVNWGGGMVFDEVQTDLEAEGYEVIPFLLPACGVNAPHRRDRIWFVAYSDDKRRYKRLNKVQEENGQICERHINSKLSDSNDATFADTSSNGGRKNNGFRKSRFFNQKSKTNKWEDFPTEPPICGGNDGISEGLDGITFSKWRNESIKAYGNAIVPQVAYEIFKTINKIEHEKRNERP